MTLESEGRVLLHFAVAYGFRNIQNLVQKLKRGRCPYHYVEVMACPSGSHSRPTLHRLHGDQCRRQHPAGQGEGDAHIQSVALRLLFIVRMSFSERE